MLAVRRTSNCTATSSLRDWKASKDGQQPCFTPKGRYYLSTSFMAVTVRLSRSWEDLYCHHPLFTMFSRRHRHKQIEAVSPGASCCRGGFALSCGYPPSFW